MNMHPNRPLPALALAALLLAVSPASAAAPSPAPATSAEAEVQAFLDEYIRRTNTHDFEQVAPLFAEDAEYGFNGSYHRGLPAIRKAFSATWDTVKEEVYSVHGVRWLAVDRDTAAVSYEYRWRGLIQGKPQSGGGRGTNVFRRIDGVWRIVHEHLSAPPRPAAKAS
jgi:uncharacterized protein (TIGR02246 family)